MHKKIDASIALHYIAIAGSELDALFQPIAVEPRYLHKNTISVTARRNSVDIIQDDDSTR